MKVFTAQQMRDFDKVAVEEYGIPSIVLMENAALRVVEFLEAKFSPLREKKIVILCGKGNNGGDGLAIARHLMARNKNVWILPLCRSEEFSGDATTNFNALFKAFDGENNFGPGLLTFEPYCSVDEQFPPIGFGDFQIDLVIDCILGTGFHLPLDKIEFRDALYFFNTAHASKISVDVSSALEADSGAGENLTAKPDFTVSFAAPKRGFFLREGLERSGEVWIGEIGTAPIQMDDVETGIETLDLETAQQLIPKRTIDAHKGDAGRVLIIGGSFGMSGAVALASRAALNAGCGLCIAAMPEKVLPIFAASILEATSHPLPCDESGKLLERAFDELPELWRGVQVVALGPGIGRSDETQNLVRRIVRECPVPLVIDADALHALPQIAEEVKAREADTILTPHPGEMGTLMGISAGEVNNARFETVEACAKKYGAIVVLKGARTLVATPDGQIFVNLTGNAGMATGGSGDVLTGTIAGLLAQLKNSESATKLGVYLHGFAGDLAFEEKGNGLVAGDITAHLGRALVEIPKREVERINGRLRKLM